MNEREWTSLIGRRILVKLKPIIAYLADNYSAIYEVRVVEVSPSGKYVKFKGDIDGWEPVNKWEILEVLK